MGVSLDAHLFVGFGSFWSWRVGGSVLFCGAGCAGSVVGPGLGHVGLGADPSLLSSYYII